MARERLGLDLLRARHRRSDRCRPALFADLGRPGIKPSGPLKLVGQLLDLPLVDNDDRWCGIVDDVEFSGSPGEEVRIKALLVGPGAYKGRMPEWMYWLVRQIAGNRITRVPLEEIGTIGSAVHLKCRAEKVGLHMVENKFRSWIPRKGAM